MRKFMYLFAAFALAAITIGVGAIILTALFMRAPQAQQLERHVPVEAAAVEGGAAPGCRARGSINDSSTPLRSMMTLSAKT